ncbi:ATP synthase F1 subunit gamma [Blattabacterium cuenoti]|uniref:ATP synthase F1 subunit gamma n=1 Tax=Blattabacterium cuenoti TaxID=1653831 RepID=UPI00293BE941|nr:ATP synthase F1 subunit gamma [Blattabacterium cuenoti]
MISNTKEIKKRILSIDSVIKTTESMKMISIVKLQKYKNFLTHIKIYSEYLEILFKNFLLECDKNLKNNRYFISNKKNKLFIVLTSDRGLCGSFNSLIFEKIDKISQKKGFSQKKCFFFPIGKKGFDFLFKKKYKIYNQKQLFNDLTYNNIDVLIKKLIKDFISKKITSIYLIYNHIKKSFFQEIIIEKLLPIIIPTFFSKKKHRISYNYFLLEPSKEKILNILIPKFIKIKLWKSLLESSTSEHTARMISMHKATENAHNIKKNLILNYNKERQTTITKEILEIISGLEALNI